MPAVEISTNYEGLLSLEEGLKNYLEWSDRSCICRLHSAAGNFMAGRVISYAGISFYVCLFLRLFLQYDILKVHISLFFSGINEGGGLMKKLCIMFAAVLSALVVLFVMPQAASAEDTFTCDIVSVYDIGENYATIKLSTTISETYGYEFASGVFIAEYGTENWEAFDFDYYYEKQDGVISEAIISGLQPDTKYQVMSCLVVVYGNESEALYYGEEVTFTTAKESQDYTVIKVGDVKKSLTSGQKGFRFYPDKTGLYYIEETGNGFYFMHDGIMIDDMYLCQITDFGCMDIFYAEAGEVYTFIPCSNDSPRLTVKDARNCGVPKMEIEDGGYYSGYLKNDTIYELPGGKGVTYEVSTNAKMISGYACQESGVQIHELLAGTSIFNAPDGTSAFVYFYTESGKDPLVTIGRKVHTPIENVRAFVSRLYTVILNREPEADGLRTWSIHMYDLGMPGAEVARGFILSQEYQDRKRTNEEYLQDLYRAFFDREPDEGGFDIWMDYLEQGVGRDFILSGFLNSVEFKNLCDSFGVIQGSYTAESVTGRNPEVTKFVSRMYTKCLSRKYEQAGLEDWTGKLLRGESTGESVAFGFFMSREYQDKKVSNEEYVETLYRTIFDRKPDTAGFDAWVSYLNAGMSREEVLYGFTKSLEFRNLCDSFGVRVR